MLASTALTYWLAAANAALMAAWILLYGRPIVSVLRYVAIFTLVSFSLRPALAASVGGYTNYATTLGLEAYNRGLLCQLGFHLALTLGYVLGRRRDGGRPPSLVAVPTPSAFFAAAGLGVAGLAALTAVAGTAWLPTMRTTTIDVAVPGGKYLFPISIISFSVLIPLGMLVSQVGRRLSLAWALGGIAFAISALSLLQVRGFVLTGILLVGWVLDRAGRLRVRHVVGGLVGLFLLGNVLRPLGSLIARRVAGAPPDVATVVAEAAVREAGVLAAARAALLYTTSNDLADTWPVVFEYVERHGLSYGGTLLAIPTRFLPTRLRLAARVTTAGDRINVHHYGEAYAEKSFGMNVTLPNELVMAFGALGVALGVLPGLLMGIADRWLARVRVLTPLGVFVVYACFAVGFYGEPAASVQWLVGVLVVGIAVHTLSGIRLTPRSPAAAPAPTVPA